MPDVVAFVHGGVSVLVATSGEDRTPALTRAAAPRVAPDRSTVDVFVGRAQGAACLANLAPGRTMAVLFGSPVDYRMLQIKGRSAGWRDVAVGDPDWVDRYWPLFVTNLERIGLAPAKSQRLSFDDIVCVTFAPTAIFRQTPGPGAGGPLEAGTRWE